MSSESNTITLQELLNFLGNEVIESVGPQDRIINKPAPIHESENKHNITFCNLLGVQAAELVNATKAGVILCSINLNLADLEIIDKTLILVEEPRLTFLRLVKALFSPPKPTGIHPTAVISPNAEIASNVYIGPFTYVGDCEIGEGVVIYGHSHIYDNTRLGRNVIVHAGTVIGADGFGYHRNEEGVLEKFPHIGGVVVEDDVEIGSNTCIDKGALGNTHIKKGTKIDNLVYIAHNVVIGEYSLVIAHSMIGGSSRVGNESWIAPCACIRDKISIGDKAIVGLGAVVTQSVPDNVVVVGVPAKSVEKYKKNKEQIKNQESISDK